MSVGKGCVRLPPGLAELVLAVLEVRKRVPAEAVRALDLPERERDQTAYLTALREWQAEIAGLRDQFAETKEALNAEVYGVYGLEADKETFEAFLARFQIGMTRVSPPASGENRMSR